MTQRKRTLRNFRELAEIPKGSMPSEEEFITIYNDLVNELNHVLTHLALDSNFNSEVISDIVIEAGETVRLGHSLSKVPQYRMILRQVGNGLVTDGDFTEKYVELVNNGLEQIQITVGLFRE